MNLNTLVHNDMETTAHLADLVSKLPITQEERNELSLTIALAMSESWGKGYTASCEAESRANNLNTYLQ